MLSEWREHCAKYEALHLAEVKEHEQQEEKEKLLHIEQEKDRAKERELRRSLQWR